MSNQKDHSNNTFKFKLIGEIFYDRYASEEFLDRFGERKFTSVEFKSILGDLYNLRSYIAHGNYKSLNNCKIWKGIATVRSRIPTQNVHFPSDDIQATYKHVALAIDLLQIHFISFIIGAKEDLLKGAKIIDDVSFSFKD